MIWILFLLSFSLAHCKSINQTEDKLIFAQVIFRHGDRTIRLAYPNDPYKDKSHWPEGFGQLTNSGKRRQYELGQFLHRRYAKFLGETYSPDKIYVQSSDYDRTINSANLVLAGLFPPTGKQIWNDDLLWQSIPVRYTPKRNDYLISAEHACDRYLRDRVEYEKSPEVSAILAENKELFEYLEKHSGNPIRTLEHLKDLHGTLDVENRLNKTLPDWAQQVFTPNGTFENLATFWLECISATPELKKLKSGFLLKDVLDRFKNKTLSLLPDRLMWVYSGHDVTIATMLNSLGVFDHQVPPYSSSLLFELYESEGSHYVQLFYRNSTAEDLAPINIPNCGTKCTLNQWYKAYSDILPTTDFETECDLGSTM